MHRLLINSPFIQEGLYNTNIGNVKVYRDYSHVGQHFWKYEDETLVIPPPSCRLYIPNRSKLIAKLSRQNYKFNLIIFDSDLAGYKNVISAFISAYRIDNYTYTLSVNGQYEGTTRDDINYDRLDTYKPYNVQRTNNAPKILIRCSFLWRYNCIVYECDDLNEAINTFVRYFQSDKFVALNYSKTIPAYDDGSRHNQHVDYYQHASYYIDFLKNNHAIIIRVLRYVGIIFYRNLMITRKNNDSCNESGNPYECIDDIHTGFNHTFAEYTTKKIEGDDYKYEIINHLNKRSMEKRWKTTKSAMHSSIIKAC